MTSTNPWQWSPEDQKYYRVEINHGIGKYVWRDQIASDSQSIVNQDPHAAEGSTDADVQKSLDYRGALGTRWYESLDTSYRVRTRAEVLDFWTRGRVFAMLWAEPAGTPARGDDGYSNSMGPTLVSGRFGEKIYSTIRRFVVTRVNRTQHFVEACVMTTNGNRGALKAGCRPSEHAIVYLSGDTPTYLPGEYERGMTKQPIQIVPTNPGEKLAPASRIRFGKSFSIEMNVKVKDIGKVCREHLTMFLRYYHDERMSGFEAEPDDDLEEDSYQVDISAYRVVPSGAPHSIGTRASEQVSRPSMSAITDSAIRVDNYDNRLSGDLHRDFEVIGNPRGFFKKGRVVMVPWPELGGPWLKDPVGLSGSQEPPVKIKIRRFVVIRPKATFCLCLSINTYQGQATTKTGIAVSDHAAVVVEGGPVILHEREAELQKSPIFIKVENESAPPVDPMSRINFAKVYTLEYNVKVRNIGRIVPDSVWRMDEYFVESTRT